MASAVGIAQAVNRIGSALLMALSNRSIRWLQGLIAVLCLALALPAAASAKPNDGPKLTVPKAELEASFHCPQPIGSGPGAPIMLVTGTSATGEQAYLIGQRALELYGHPVCYVDFPDFTTADIQVSVQYLVYGLRREFALAGRKVAVIGISQGGLLPRFALTYWPDLRRKVGDLLSAAGSQHGSNVGDGCSAASPCTPANWQQQKGSNLLRALNRQPDETPGRTAYTTVRSLTDETVQPQSGKRPTSALDGATNVLIQDVCPGRATTHIGTAIDSVTFAAFDDAVTHRGPAKLERLPDDVCANAYAPGLDAATGAALLGAADGLTSGQSDAAPKVAAEPRVKRVFKRVRSE